MNNLTKNQITKILSALDPGQNKDLTSLLDAIESGPARHIVPTTELGCDLSVSTVNSVDMGPETAILDADGNARIVERYETEELAIEGHQRWVEKAATLTKVLDVGYGTSVPPTEYELARK